MTFYLVPLGQKLHPSDEKVLPAKVMLKWMYLAKWILAIFCHFFPFFFIEKEKTQTNQVCPIYSDFALFLSPSVLLWIASTDLAARPHLVTPFGFFFSSLVSPVLGN